MTDRLEAGATMPACFAPSVQLHFAPDGAISACCTSQQRVGLVGRDALLDVWHGPALRELRDRMARHDYRMGCASCGLEIELEGREGSIPVRYDHYAATLDLERDPLAWPRQMDFMLSNACNLQCVQCSGEFSSAIRSQREGRPPIVSPYDDAFFEQIRDFLPHLELATFEGGEPFLSPLNFRLWDLIAEVAPDLVCVICTNGTQFTRRVEEVIRSLNVGIIVSMDGATPATFEAIRLGADHAEVLANARRMFEIALAKGLPASINHCMMPSNYHEFGELLLLADQLGVVVDVDVVRSPRHSSIWHLPAPEIARIADHFAAEDEMWQSRLVRNRDTWVRETGRVRSWATATGDALAAAQGSRILVFSTLGDGPTRPDESRVELQRRAPGRVVHELTVSRDDTVVDCSPSLEDVLGPRARELPGAGSELLGELVRARFGAFSPVEIDRHADRAEYRSDLGEVIAETVMVPVRGEDGVAHVAKMFLTFEAPDPGA